MFDVPIQVEPVRISAKTLGYSAVKTA